MMPGPVPVASHDKISHGAHHFDHLDLWHAMAPLMMLFSLHNANTNVMASHGTNVNGIM